MPFSYGKFKNSVLIKGSKRFAATGTLPTALSNECIGIDARVTDEWCKVNCYDGAGNYHSACNPATDPVHRTCACGYTGLIEIWEIPT